MTNSKSSSFLFWGISSNPNSFCEIKTNKTLVLNKIVLPLNSIYYSVFSGNIFINTSSLCQNLLKIF